MFTILDGCLTYVDESLSEAESQNDQVIEALQEFNKLIALMNQPEPQTQITAQTYQFIPCVMG